MARFPVKYATGQRHDDDDYLVW